MGQFIAKELVNQGAAVIALTRGGNDKASSVGIPERVVDYASQSSLVEALKGVDVVISTVNGAGFNAQHVLADASKAAGVKLFVPSYVVTD